MGSAPYYRYESVVIRPTVVARCPLETGERDALLDAFLQVCDWVRIAYLWRPNLPDESDNHVMELAVAGGAGLIVTNNVRDFRGGELTFPDIRIFVLARTIKALGQTR